MSENMVNTYINYLSATGKDYSKHTILAYKTNVSKFLEWLKERYSESKNNAITLLDLREYQKYLLNVKKYKPTGVQQRIIAIISYCKFLYNQKYLKQDITINFELVKIQKENISPDIPTLNEMNRFRREVYKKNNTRDIAIIELFINTGIRAGELTNLQIEDIEITDRKGIINIREGKGRKYRTIPLNSDARLALKNYIDEYCPKEIFWLGQRGNLTQDGVTKMIKRYAKKVELETKIHPHVFRHYFALRLLREKKVDLVTVSNILGHFDVNTTKIYLQPSLKDISDALENLII